MHTFVNDIWTTFVTFLRAATFLNSIQCRAVSLWQLSFLSYPKSYIWCINSRFVSKGCFHCYLCLWISLWSSLSIKIVEGFANVVLGEEPVTSRRLYKAGRQAEVSTVAPSSHWLTPTQPRWNVVARTNDNGTRVAIVRRDQIRHRCLRHTISQTSRCCSLEI